MSALGDLVKGITPTPIQNIQSGGGTQNWNGQQIPSNIPVKNLVGYDHATGNKTFKLPDFIGGGVYTEDKNNNLVNTTRNDNALGLGAAKSGNERDHIIPVSLGGASQPGNGQMIPSSIANPQDTVEKNAAAQVRSGQIQPKAALTQVLRQKQQIAGQEPSEDFLHNFWSSLPDALNKLVVDDSKDASASKTMKQVKDYVQQSLPQKGDDFETKLSKSAGLALLFMGEPTQAAEENPEEANIAATSTEDQPPEPPTASPKLNDATPFYDKSMEGKYVTNAKGEYVPRVVPAKTFGSKGVNASAAETASNAELEKLPDYNPKASATERSQSVYKNIVGKANDLTEKLKAEDASNPLTNDEAKNTISKIFNDQIDYDAKPTSPVGQYQKALVEELQKYDGTRNGINELKKNAEDIYQQYRGKAAYGSDPRNAMDVANRAIRNGLKKELIESTQNADVKSSLESQSRLFNAKDVLDEKAQQEGGTYFERHPNQNMIKRSLIRGAGIAVPTAVALSPARTALTAGAKKVYTKIFGGGKTKAPKTHKIKL